MSKLSTVGNLVEMKRVNTLNPVATGFRSASALEDNIEDSSECYPFVAVWPSPMDTYLDERPLSDTPGIVREIILPRTQQVAED